MVWRTSLSVARLIGPPDVNSKPLCADDGWVNPFEELAATVYEDVAVTAVIRPWGKTVGSRTQVASKEKILPANDSSFGNID